MIHAKMCKPRAFPWNSTRDPEQIDRLQNITGNQTLNREKVYEIGRVGRLGFKKATPSFAYSATQFEYGSMAFWYDLANMTTPGVAPYAIDLDDLVETQTDIAAFLTDDNTNFRGTIWFPGLRVNGFSINIADPDATIERSFDLVGEDYKMLDAKYLSFEKATVAAPGDKTVVLDPVAIEYAAGDYIFRVLRVRSGVVSELEEGTGTNQWEYTFGIATVTVHDCLVGDVVKIYYPSATAYDTTWTDNDSDPDLLLAEYAEIRVKAGTAEKIYRLQSVGIDVAFDRADYKEIGNSEIVQRGVNNKTVTVALDRFAENFALEDILASDTTYPYIDPNDFAENIQIQIKIYSEKAHTNFKIGYLITGLSPTTIGTTQDVEAYQKRTVSLESDNLIISSLETEIAFV
jgi:hypothetical protein